MSNMHITTTQRTVAYVLLGSQLLTSCWMNETILPNKKAEITLQREKKREEIMRQPEAMKEEQAANQKR